MRVFVRERERAKGREAAIFIHTHRQTNEQTDNQTRIRSILSVKIWHIQFSYYLNISQREKSGKLLTASLFQAKPAMIQ